MVVTACSHEEIIVKAEDGTGDNIGTCEKCGQVKRYPWDGREKPTIVKEGTPPPSPRQRRGRLPKQRVVVPLPPTGTPIFPRSPLEIQAVIEAMELVKDMLKVSDDGIRSYLEGSIKSLQWVLGNKH